MDKFRFSPLPAVGAAFLAGVLLGWLIIGWWLWPVKWIETDPWDLRTEYQERYITLVAKEYDRTKDAAQVRDALAGWDKGALANLLAAMQERAPDYKTCQQLADLASALELPQGRAVASVGARVPPSIMGRLVTVFGTAAIALVVVVVIIFAASLRPWESVTGWMQRRGRAQAVRAVELLPGHFVSTYLQGQDYDDYFPIEAPNGQFLGECELSIGCTLGQGRPQQVTALKMVLFDRFDHRTETRMLMSRYAYEDAALRQRLMTRGELILAEPGIQILMETSYLRMTATIADLEYADQEPAEGIFQRVVIELNLGVKQLPVAGGQEVEAGE